MTQITQTAVATAAPILDVATGYMAAKHLFEASRIGLFAALADGPRTAEEIAAETGVSSRIATILGDALNSSGLLEREDGRYALTADTAAFLTPAGDGVDLTPYLTFLSEISFPHWLQFSGTVDTTEPGDLQMDDARWVTFLDGVMAYNAMNGFEFGRRIDLSDRSRVLDFGGLSPTFAIESMKANPDLHTTFLYVDDYQESIRTALAEAGLTDRAEVLAGDTATVVPTGEYDTVFVNHVVHRFSVEENQAILRRLRAVATPGARLTLLDYFRDTDAVQRRLDAVHAGEYLVIDGTVVYPLAEVSGWLREAGWEVREVVELPASPRVIIAEAV